MGLSREEFEKRRAERRKGITPEAIEAQREIDREAIDAIEVEEDLLLDASLEVRNFVPGCPVLIGIRTPDEAMWKRFTQSVNRANDKGSADAKVAACEQLGRACLLYPSDAKVRSALLASNPSLITDVATRAAKLVALHEEAEGKD
jgi:hypothetical protein